MGSNGDLLTIRGSSYVFGGSKFAVIKTSQGREGMAAIESPEVEFYDNGEAQLKNGEAAVRFERLFREEIVLPAFLPLTSTLT